MEEGIIPESGGFRGRDLNPDSTVQSRMSCRLDDPGVFLAKDQDARRLLLVYSEVATIRQARKLPPQPASFSLDTAFSPLLGFATIINHSRWRQ